MLGLLTIVSLLVYFLICGNSYAVVTPIQKSKESMELTNFRPISVLPVLSKVLERVVYDQLLSHLLTFDLLFDRQSGFRPQCSTQDVLLHIIGVLA